jgi:hypothetical protein
MIIGVISAVVGNTIINYAVRKYRKTWFVIAILAASILLSMVLLGYLGLFRTLRSYLEVLPLPHLAALVLCTWHTTPPTRSDTAT